MTPDGPRGTGDPMRPLEDCEWVPRGRRAPLARLGIATVADLLRHYPRRHEDRRAFAAFPDSELDEPVCLHGVVGATRLKRFGGRRCAYEAVFSDPSGGAFSHPLTLRWFNMPYIQNAILVGHELVVYGRPKLSGKTLFIDHPEFEILDEADPSPGLHMRRIVPVHPAGEGVSQRVLRGLVWKALAETDCAGLALAPVGGFEDALRAVHFPESFDDLDAARRRLALDESYAMQVVVRMRRNAWHDGPGRARIARAGLVERLLASLPFRLTGAQERAWAAVRADIESPRRMNRLLQGDVGSGKTLVAMAAMVHAIDAGFPAALMAPTQILAEQHHIGFRRLLEPLGIGVRLWTGNRKTGDTPLFDQGPVAVIGTHALLCENALPAGTGLVVIDEQHKFGVLQRARLLDLPGAPDALVMSATPIPRTLAQTLYGDLEISVIDEKPPGRGSVRTVVRPSAKLAEAGDFLRKHLLAGRQAYIVYPLIEESEKLEAKAAEDEFARWREMLSPLPVALLHGRTPADERERTMAAFRAGESAALVATTVIEVGVDVPNATILLVENAERFGLAQLHQLRGRIGRGAEKSFCILLHDPKAKADAVERLKILEATEDGFRVAEEDLRLRGPGNILGTAQAGLPPLRLPELSLSPQILGHASQLAQETLARDPSLAGPANARLRAVAGALLAREAAAATQA